MSHNSFGAISGSFNNSRSNLQVNSPGAAINDNARVNALNNNTSNLQVNSPGAAINGNARGNAQAVSDASVFFNNLCLFILYRK
jgi:hypothetical protein